MRKLLLLAIIVLFTSCSKDESEVQPKATSVAVCGVVNKASTLFTNAGSFIGVQYGMVLNPTYFDGTTTWTKARFIINNAQNTPLIQQYWTNPQSVYCGNIPITNLYN